MRLPVAILAGGVAMRLRPITEHVPKILVDIDGRPFAAHQLDLLKRQGVSRVVYCVGYRGEQVQQVLGDGDQWGLQLEYVFDGPQLLGTGGALRQAVDLLDDAFFVLYGDSYLPCDFASIETAFLRSGKSGLMTVFRNNDAWDRSNVVFADGRILQYDKNVTLPEMRHIDDGLGVLARRSLDGYPRGVFLDLATVYRDLLARDDLAGYEVKERFYEIGSPQGLEELRSLIGGAGGRRPDVNTDLAK
jgi:NDP-sugar pyrophosphorylase family protein